MFCSLLPDNNKVKFSFFSERKITLTVYFRDIHTQKKKLTTHFLVHNNVPDICEKFSMQLENK